MFYIKFILVLFCLFICCGCGLALAIFQWGNPQLNPLIARWFSRWASRIAGVEIEVLGQEDLKRTGPCIYIGNHQDSMDLVIFSRVYPDRTVTIGKRELFWVPFFGQFFWAAGNVMINRKRRDEAVAGLSAAVKAIHEKAVSILIFPEGTRNTTSAEMLPFKKGAFYMAVQAQVPIVPIVCSPVKSLVSWSDRRLLPGKVQLRALAPIPTQGLGIERVDELIAEARAKMIEAFRGLSTQLRN